MADPKGFMTTPRETPTRRPVDVRIQDWREVYEPQSFEHLQKQAGRCMDCGIPFCHNGCPLGNLIPEWNDLIWRGDKEEAVNRLHATNNFPEFTGRLCPAPCETACVVAINRDAVTIKQVELITIEEAFDARMQSEDKLRRFVADASHELRTPLTAIRGFAELHRQGAVPEGEKTNELISRIEKESMRMGYLVEDLLMLARMDQSRELVIADVNLSELVQEAVTSAQAAGPDHTITTSIALGIATKGDADKIYQVVTNLLANARAHTPAGTAIHVATYSADDGTYVTVADKGPGLTAEDQQHIFERFYRVDTSRQRSSSDGRGLGLSIVDEVMKAHGGSVSVSSEPGNGATFTLHFKA